MSEISLAFLLLVIYMLPSVIAQSRIHYNYGAIVALNVFLGWTVLGWVCALVWALTAKPRKLHDAI